MIANWERTGIETQKKFVAPVNTGVGTNIKHVLCMIKDHLIEHAVLKLC